MNCSEMKLGEVYVCGDCGLELKVVKECDCTEGLCTCDDVACCGGELTLKA